MPLRDARQCRSQVSRQPDLALIAASHTAELAEKWGRPRCEWSGDTLIALGRKPKMVPNHKIPDRGVRGYSGAPIFGYLPRQ